MLPHDEREKLAREAYSAAVKVACEKATPSSWARLLRAAKNLHEALVDVDGLSVGQPNEC